MTGGRWLGNAALRIFSNGNLDLAKYDQDGEEETAPHFPWSLRFEANPYLVPTHGNSRFYQQMIKGGDAEIPPNTLLYDVHAKNSALEDAEEFLIGSVWS